MSRAAVTLLSIALMAVVFAGCLEADPAPADTTEEPLPWTAPLTLPRVDAAKLLLNHKDFVTKFPVRRQDTDMHKQARDAIAKAFNESGLQVLRQAFTQSHGRENVCGILWGHERAEWVVVGAHYDTAGHLAPSGAPSESQGAYDDGSGTWLVIELAKAFAATKPYFTTLFCAFDGEESGLVGSKYLFESMKGGKFPFPVNETRGMLDLDMFGINWPVPATIWFDQNAPQIREHVDAKRKELKIPDSHFKFSRIRSGQSDFAHWYNSGVPTVFFISDFEEWWLPAPSPVPAQQVPTTYPFWHRFDTYENMERMAGGAEPLRQGFQTALDLSGAVIDLYSFRPGVKLEGVGK